MYYLWNSGFECAWKCEKVMRRQYFFWILNKCSNWPVFRGAAQTILQYAMYGSTRAKYKTRVWVSGRIWRTFAIIPTFLADLLRTTSMCLLQPRSEDIITPRNFASNCCSILIFPTKILATWFCFFVCFALSHGITYCLADVYLVWKSYRFVQSVSSILQLFQWYLCIDAIMYSKRITFI